MNETNSSGWDYHTLNTVNQSSGGESLMQSSKSLIDSSWLSHQSLHCHCLHITKASFPTLSPRHTRQAIREQNHGPMQKVTIEVQLQPVWPLTVLFTEISNAVQPRQQVHSAQDEPDSSDHGKHADSWTSKNMKATGWVNNVWPVCDWIAYFLVAPCLCADNRTGSDGGGTSPSHDLCHRSLVSDTGFPSYLHEKHLWTESHIKVITHWVQLAGRCGASKHLKK